MKRFVVLLSLLFSSFTYADTINLHWLNEDGTTYQNSTCVIDSDLIIPATTPTRYGYTFTGWEILNYIPIEYIEFTGTQYIDTGVFINDTYGFSVISQKNINHSRDDQCVIGVKGSGDSRWIYAPSENCYMSWNTYTSFPEISTTDLHTVSMNFLNNRKRIIDGVSKEDITQTLSTSANQHSVCIGAVKWETETPSKFFTGKIYRLQISRSSEIIRDFIPVLDKDGTPCMYDRVTEQFFYNQGTGQFLAGPVLTE